MSKISRLIAVLLAGAPLALGSLSSVPAAAAPAIAQPVSPSPLLQNAQIFQRGRPPIYPYYYVPPQRPGGWSFYFGPVPYAKGDFETQALQRVYPESNYPPSMRGWTPKSGF